MDRVGIVGVGGNISRMVRRMPSCNSYCSTRCRSRYRIVLTCSGMFRLALTAFVASVCLSVGDGGRYKAPRPADVSFPYRRIPKLTELIRDGGHQHNRYNVTTDDGHILALHRVSSRGARAVDRGFPVLLVNGFGFQSDGWLALGSSSLPFILADLGYDVWLGDQRGSTRSLEHVSYAVDDWRNHNYTFHEQGVYDLPAFIDKILDTTGRRHLLYVGYSLSAGMMIVMNSERPEYNDKVLGAAMLAPAGHLMKWEENGFQYLAGIRVVDSMLDDQIRRGAWLFLGNTDFVKRSTTSCDAPLLNRVCRMLIFNMYGISDVMDPVSMFYQFAITVTSVSAYTGKHLLQVIKLGRFSKVDYGAQKNLEVYGMDSPPNYDFGNTKIPVYLFYGGTDKMVTPKAAKRTGRELGNVVKEKFIKRFNHADFVFGKSAPKEVYEGVVEFFDGLVATTLER